MKIPLKFEDGLLYILGYLKIEGRKGFDSIEFIVDTGSNQTYINWPDVLKLNIPYNRLSKPSSEKDQYTGIGGELLELREAGQTSLYFINEENKPSVFVSSSVLVGRPTKSTKKYAVPSIIGTDFLIEHKLCFAF